MEPGQGTTEQQQQQPISLNPEQEDAAMRNALLIQEPDNSEKPADNSDKAFRYMQKAIMWGGIIVGISLTLSAINTMMLIRANNRRKQGPIALKKPNTANYSTQP